MKENPFLYAIKFFFLYSAEKDSVWRNKNFRVFLILCYIRKLASLKIFHLQKALLLDITQKQKRKNNWLFFRFEQHRKKSIPTINSDWTDCTLLWCFFVKIHAHHFQLVWTVSKKRHYRRTFLILLERYTRIGV